MIFISGKISGLPFEEVEAKFDYAEQHLRELGYTEIFNPISLAHEFGLDKDWGFYLSKCIEVLASPKCQEVYMLLDWKDSKGARIDYATAKEFGKIINYE